MLNKIKKFLGIHVHEWSKWKKSQETWLYRYIDGSKVPNSQFIRYKHIRECKICGQEESHRTST